MNFISLLNWVNLWIRKRKVILTFCWINEIKSAPPPAFPVQNFFFDAGVFYYVQGGTEGLFSLKKHIFLTSYNFPQKLISKKNQHIHLEKLNSAIKKLKVEYNWLTLPDVLLILFIPYFLFSSNYVNSISVLLDNLFLSH